MSSNASQAMPVLSIIFVNWNGRDMLGRCLASLEDNVQTFKRSDVETFVVDNASSDGSAAMVRERFPWVRLIENTHNTGFARANNQGLEASNGRFAFLLNNDAFVQPRALEVMLGFMETHVEVGILGCQLLNEDGSPQGSFADFPTLCSALLGTDFRRHNRRCADGALEVDAVSGACMMVRQEAWHEVGGMDEAYALFAEEVDWCYRMRKAGWRVCSCRDARVVHLLGQSRKNRSLFAYLNLHRSRILFFRKHYGRLQAELLRLGYILVGSSKTMLALLGKAAGRTDSQRKLHENWTLCKWLILQRDALMEGR